MAEAPLVSGFQIDNIPLDSDNAVFNDLVSDLEDTAPIETVRYTKEMQDFRVFLVDIQDLDTNNDKAKLEEYKKISKNEQKSTLLDPLVIEYFRRVRDVLMDPDADSSKKHAAAELFLQYLPTAMSVELSDSHSNEFSKFQSAIVKGYLRKPDGDQFRWDDEDSDNESPLDPTMMKFLENVCAIQEVYTSVADIPVLGEVLTALSDPEITRDMDQEAIRKQMKLVQDVVINCMSNKDNWINYFDQRQEEFVSEDVFDVDIKARQVLDDVLQSVGVGVKEGSRSIRPSEMSEISGWYNSILKKLTGPIQDRILSLREERNQQYRRPETQAA